MNTKQFKILIVTYNLENLGGVPRATTLLANSLFDEGYQVGVVSISPGPIPVERSLREGIEYSVCNSKIQSTQKFFSQGFGRKIRSFLVRRLRRWKPKRARLVFPTQEGIAHLTGRFENYSSRDLCIVTDVNSMDYVLRVFRNKTKKPKIIGQYKGTVDNMLPVMRERVVEAYGEVDAITVLTEEDADALQKHTKVPVSFTYEMIESPDPVDLPQIQKKFVAMGRLSREKSFHHVINAWKKVSSIHPDWRLEIYGDGPEKDRLASDIERARLSKYVELKGVTQSPIAVLSAAYAHVSCSQTEGFGLVVSEASSVGTPTIAFNCSPGIRVQIRNKVSGILVPKNDTESLAKEIIDLIDNPGGREKMSMAALDHVKLFQRAEFLERIETVIHEVMSR